MRKKFPAELSQRKKNYATQMAKKKIPTQIARQKNFISSQEMLYGKDVHQEILVVVVLTLTAHCTLVTRVISLQYYTKLVLFLFNLVVESRFKNLIIENFPFIIP